MESALEKLNKYEENEDTVDEIKKFGPEIFEDWFALVESDIMSNSLQSLEFYTTSMLVCSEEAMKDTEKFMEEFSKICGKKKIHSTMGFLKHVLSLEE